MRITLERQCARFIENRDIVKSVYRWESGYLVPVAAACCGSERADAERLRGALRLIKREAGPFSAFRGMARPVIAAMLAQEADPETALRDALDAYKALRGQFMSSIYLPMAALTLTRWSENFHAAAEETRAVYEEMKKDHRFLTSSEDCVFAALLALSPYDAREAEREAEACYIRLRTYFPAGNGLQSLSHVLALGEGDADVKCDRTMTLYEELRRTTLRYGRGYELPVLGALALIGRDPSELAEDLSDADEYLQGQKGYGVFGAGATSRRMHAALIVIEASLDPEAKTLSHMAAGLAGVYAAQQAAIMAACASAGAATAASSSSH